MLLGLRSAKVVDGIKNTSAQVAGTTDHGSLVVMSYRSLVLVGKNSTSSNTISVMAMQ